MQGRGGKGRAQADSLAGPRGLHLVQALKKQRETDPRKVLRTQSGRGGRGAQGVREGCGLFQGGGKDVLGIVWWGQRVNPRWAEHMQGQAEGQRARGRRGLHGLAFYDQCE